MSNCLYLYIQFLVEFHREIHHLQLKNIFFQHLNALIEILRRLAFANKYYGYHYKLLLSLNYPPLYTK